MPNDHVDKIAEIIEREVLSQTSIAYGSVDWLVIAGRVYREMIADAAVEKLLGPGDHVTITRPMTHTCQCKNSVKRHEFGRGTRCMNCGLPA